MTKSAQKPYEAGFLLLKRLIDSIRLLISVCKTEKSTIIFFCVADLIFNYNSLTMSQDDRPDILSALEVESYVTAIQKSKIDELGNRAIYNLINTIIILFATK
jgi:hypothetical protein